VGEAISGMFADAIACLGLRKCLDLELSHGLGVKGGLLVRSYRVWSAFLGGDRPAHDQRIVGIAVLCWLLGGARLKRLE
jgi:hypothetical protein